MAVPVYNGAAHLGACLESVLRQSYPALEIVVADGGSSDASASIVAAIDDPRVRCLEPAAQPLGLHANWERALRACRGDYVKLLCQDDLITPDCVEVQAGLLSDHPRAALVANRRVVIDDDGRVLLRTSGISTLTAGSPSRELSAAEAFRSCVRSGTNLFGEPASVMFRRAALPEPLLDRRWTYAVDLDLYLRTASGGRAVVDDRLLAAFRVSQRQLSAALAARQAREMRAFFSEVRRLHPAAVGAGDQLRGRVGATARAFARRAVYRWPGIGRGMAWASARRSDEEVEVLCPSE